MFKFKTKFPVSTVVSNSPLNRKEAELLASFLLNDRLYLESIDKSFNCWLYIKYKYLEKRFLKNIPFAYLTGHKAFYNLDFKVNKKVLVPRPETEIMVDNIIELFSKLEKENPFTEYFSKPLIIDVGTGSGAIIITLASELKRLYPEKFSKIEFKAIDISGEALEVAKINAKTHELYNEIKFYQGDLLKPVISNLNDCNIIIAANLPYLTPEQVKGSPSISREPKLALVAGDDGLKYYRELFKQLQNIKYKSLSLFCEIDASQTEIITRVANDNFPKAKLEIIKDYANLDRFIKIENSLE